MIMSFDDYAKYITQKHRLSIAIAIIKSRPDNLTTEEYINELLNKIIMTDDKLELMIASDDFNFDDDVMDISDTILKDFGIEDVEENVQHSSQETYCEDSTQIPIIIDNDATYCEGIDSDSTAKQDSDHSVAINNNITHAITKPANIKQITAENSTENPKTYANTSNKDVDKNGAENTYRIAKSADIKRSTAEANCKAYIPNTTKAISKNIVTDVMNNIDITLLNKDTNMTADSQKTIIYTVPTFTQEYTHYSPSQTQLSITSRLIHGTDRDDTVGITKESIKPTNSRIFKGVNNKKVFILEEVSKITNTTKGQIEIITNSNDERCNNQDQMIKEPSRSIESEDIQRKHLTEEAIINVSQNIFSQDANTDEYYRLPLINNDNLNHNNLINEDHHKGLPKNIYVNDISQTNDTTMSMFDADRFKRSTQSLKRTDKNVNFEIYIDKNLNINIPTVNHDFRNDIDTATDTNYPTNITTDTEFTKDTNTLKNIDMTFDIQLSEDITNDIEFTEHINNTESVDFTSDIQIANDIGPTLDIERESSEGNTEVVPFKILGEFNKVKSLLNRERRVNGEGYSSDSGYRSDSQGKSSKSALQISGNSVSWLNQSGQSLFDYIMECHLMSTTRDISNEIAEVLGQLIDKLHEDEKYPSFLETLLETVDVLLRRIYEGDNSIDGVLLTRDETLQRLVLLNKSKHIQIYTIEKINNILNDYHSKITDELSVFELSNIDQIENFYYIFHILEIILRKYIKSKDLSSQISTQQSQEEAIIKKSSITDIWKRKWNPDYKDGGVVDSCEEKKCVLSECSKILKKLIVDSIDGYSLVSFAALKCFNLMKS